MRFLKKLQRKLRCRKTSTVSPMDVSTLTTEESQPGNSVAREAARLQKLNPAEVYTRYFKQLPSSKYVEVPYTSWNHLEATRLDELDPAVKITYDIKQISSTKFVEVSYKSWKRQEAAGRHEPDPAVVRIEFFKQLSSSKCVQVPYTSINHSLFEELSQETRQVFVHSLKDCQCSSLTLEGATTTCPFAAVREDDTTVVSSSL